MKCIACGDLMNLDEVDTCSDCGVSYCIDCADPMSHNCQPESEE